MTEMTMPLDFTIAASRPFPLGVSEARHSEIQDPDTVNIAVFAPALPAVDVHYRAPGGHWRRAPLTENAGGVHHGHVPGFVLGTHYGFVERHADREQRPQPGAASLLLDPYGRGVIEQDGRTFSVLTHADFDWGQDQRPNTLWRDTIIYEAHVKGLTMLHPDIPQELRGTYAGMAHPAIVEHLLQLGVTAVELLPIHFHTDEDHLANLGKENYWGYNTASFFAPHPGYASKAAQAAGPGAVQDEFKGMVKLLHAAGLEVILDVVYNHTAEGGQGGAVQSFRGLGEFAYYRNDGEGHYVDTTGCGNTLDFSQPRVVQLALDSLRHWVKEYHVDGFRFDLAVTLCRDRFNNFDPKHPFLVALAADPAFHDVKLIAEPWDVGYGGWQTGNFPFGWADWNDRFRDTVRSFWLPQRAAIQAGCQGDSLALLAQSLSGSAPLFQGSGRSRLASVNFITSHDGFTLADLTSYDRKHNEANGEQNRDGTNDNNSFNHGFEGLCEDEAVVNARMQSARNLMTTLMVSLGVPMITAGDELFRSQQGNNNAYCQDNELSWIDWRETPQSRSMLESTRTAIRIRKNFLAGQPYDYPHRETAQYLHWFNQFGQPMPVEQWNDQGVRVLQLFLGSQRGQLDGLVVINGSGEEVQTVLPALPLEAPETGSTDSSGPESSEPSTDDSAGSAEGADAQHPLAPGSAHYVLRTSTATANDARRGTVVSAGGTDRVAAFSINIYRVSQA